MTPREKNIAAVVSAIVGMLIAFGGLFAYGSSRISEVKVLEARVQSLETRLDRFENKIDKLDTKLERLLEKR